MKRKRWRMALMLGLVSVAAVAAFGPLGGPLAGASTGTVFDVQIGSPATLTARDAAVKVPIYALCTRRTAWLQVQVTERVGRRTAQGTAGQVIQCTGGIEALVITVPASANSFKKGAAAVVNASIGFCDFCGTEASATAEVPVVRR
jgi:hypothetical protein